MPMFKCSSCQAVYEDHYPPDDICIKCNAVTIRIMPSQGGNYDRDNAHY